MKTALENSFMADIVRWLWNLLKRIGWGIRCVFGWHQWKAYTSIFTEFAPLRPVRYEACVHCGRTRHGSEHLVAEKIGDAS